MSEPPVTDADATPHPVQPAARAGPDPALAAGGAATRDGDDGGQISLGARLRQPRTILSLGDPAGPAGPDLPGRAQRRLRGARRRASPSANKLLLLAAFLVFYARLPAPRPALGDPAQGRRHARSGSRTRPRSCSCRGLVNCLVPAKLGDLYRAFLLKINARRRWLADVRHGVHRAHPRPVRDRDHGPRSPASGASGPACRPRSSSSAPSASASIVVLAGFLFTLRNFGRAILERASRSRTGSSSSTTGSRRACSAINRRASCGRS